MHTGIIFRGSPYGIGFKIKHLNKRKGIRLKFLQTMELL
ncbi:hypothetical protein PAGA_a2811 [Pseudoalteromonas agarivorans DSM 14585]|uniref:Uncharacterized protein n=1 Tax=Pseudoalteromonas agarivorans DSM 14585 TaxID=1312369 RepID=A0ACA8DYW6_9GAMM|nr:hypothetical protein PAGA_a2811 [Pseudoalteromonas agarivorans DSM 14585]